MRFPWVIATFWLALPGGGGAKKNYYFFLAEHVAVSADSGGLFDTRESALDRARARAYRSLRSLCSPFEGEVSYGEEACRVVLEASGRPLWSCTVSARVSCTLCPCDPNAAPSAWRVRPP